jgi:hypothetical protein
MDRERKLKRCPEWAKNVVFEFAVDVVMDLFGVMCLCVCYSLVDYHSIKEGKGVRHLRNQDTLDNSANDGEGGEQVPADHSSDSQGCGCGFVDELG